MLSQKQKKRFRTIGHQLKPVVTIAGNGLSDSVVAELVRALNDHELIKIKIYADDRSERSSVLESIVEKTACDVIQTIGGMALIYKAAKEPNPVLSNLKRLGAS